MAPPALVLPTKAAQSLGPCSNPERHCSLCSETDMDDNTEVGNKVEYVAIQVVTWIAPIASASEATALRKLNDISEDFPTKDSLSRWILADKRSPLQR